MGVTADGGGLEVRGMVRDVQDQCPHCYKKLLQEEMLELELCPYCGKKIIADTIKDEAPPGYYDSFPKVPPRLDWVVIPFGGVVAAPLPVVLRLTQWLLGGFEALPAPWLPLSVQTLLAVLFGAAAGRGYLVLCRRHEARRKAQLRKPKYTDY